MNDRETRYVVVQVVLVAAALLAPVVGLRSDPWPTGVAVLGCLSAVAGIGIVAVASVTLGQRSLSPFPKPKAGSVLVQHGVFALVRHPVYSGLTLFVLGWGVAWSSLTTVAGAFVLLVFFDVKARREERWLEEKFADYATYKWRVKKLVPFIY